MVNWRRAFVGVKFHFVDRFPFLNSVYVFLELESVRFISNGTIEKAVVSKVADFGARRKTFMDVVNVDEKEERIQDSALGDSREDRAGVRKLSS